MIQNRVDSFFIPVDDVPDAIREPGFLPEFGEPECGRRRFLGRQCAIRKRRPGNRQTLGDDARGTVRGREPGR